MADAVNIDAPGVRAVASALHSANAAYVLPAEARICRGLVLDEAGHGADGVMPAPEELGFIYEAALSTDERKARGAWFTPPVLVGWIVDTVAEHADFKIVRSVLDPACGAGAFLLGVARRMIAEGRDARSAFSALVGWDIDAGSLLITRASLELLAHELGLSPALAHEATLVHGNFLEAASGQLDLLTAPTDPPPPVDVVVGNPPFISPLRSSANSVTGSGGQGYTDAAVLFLRESVRVLRQEGVAALVLPISVLATRDGEVARRECLGRADLRAVWLDPAADAFPGSVAVFVPFLKAPPSSSVPGEVARWRGLEFERLPAVPHPVASSANWAALLVDEDSLPRATFSDAGARRLGDVATATADFRDQFYALADVAREAGSAPDDAYPIVVTGCVDPAALLWGSRPTRLNRVNWLAPVATRADVERHPVLAEWATRRLVPKILVATQTRVLEALVDEQGRLLPCTPLISVVPGDIGLWHLAAIINSPFAARWARLASAGAARSADAIKLSARQLRDLPLPKDGPLLDEASVAFRRAQDATGTAERVADLVLSARLVLEGYGLQGDEVTALLSWWEDRLPLRMRD